MSTLKLSDLLDGMSHIEVLMLAMDTYPDRAREIKLSSDPHVWLKSNGTLDVVLPRIPGSVMERLMQAHSPEVPENSLELDTEATGTIERDLRSMSRSLVEQGKPYIPLFNDLGWYAARKRWVANVKGTTWYGVSLTRSGIEDCSCPHFQGKGQCKHTAALRMRLLEEFRSLRLGIVTAPTPVARHDALVTKGLEELRRIGEALKAPEPAAEVTKKQAVYVLELEGDSRRRIHELVPRTRNFAKSTGWKLDPVSDLRRLQGRFGFSPPSYLSPTDLEVITGCGDAPGLSWNAKSTRPLSNHPLLAKAATTKRLVLEDETPLRLDPSLWTLASQLETEEGLGRFAFSITSLDNPQAQRLLTGDWLYFGEEGAWTVLTDFVLHRLDPRTSEVLLSLTEEMPDLPIEALEEVRSELHLLSRVGVEIPLQFLPPRLIEAPIRHAGIELRDDGLVLKYLIVYPSMEVASDETQTLIAFTCADGSLAELKRDKAAETRLFDELGNLLVETSLDFKPTDSGWIITDPPSLSRFALVTLPRMKELNWEIREAQAADRWKRRSGTFKAVAKASGQDWFELSGVVDYDGFEIPLSTLITQKGDFRLPDGSVAELSQSLLKRLQWIGRLGERTEDGVLLKGFHTVLAQELLESGHAVTDDMPSWTKALMSALQTPEDGIDVPASMQATLRPYQQEGLRWLSSLRRRGIGGILADDMGLGKTIQVIAHLCRLYEDNPSLPPAMVVGPASVAGNWVSEIARFAPHLHTRLLHGNERETLRDEPITGPTIFVTTYGTLTRELDWATSQEFSILVLDESQAIRNPGTVTHQCCLQMRAAQKLCLTGTPVENSLSDLWSQFSFLNPGLLGPRDEFLHQFGPMGDEKPDLSRLRLLTAPFWLRRTKELVASDLPPRQDVILNVEMDPKQDALYQRQLKEYQKNLVPQIRKAGLENGGHFQVLTALLRLRQIACAPELAGHKGPSAKLDLLLDKLEEDLAEGHKALVFSSFTSLLDLVGERMTKAGMDFLRLDGSTPAAERTRLIKQFQEGTGPSVFLVSLKAGGAGINLTAADYVFLLDPWWNPAIEEQAAARAHRIGQERPVTLYRMVAKGTIEERVFALSRNKAALASELFDSGESGGTALTPDIVQELFG